MHNSDYILFFDTETTGFLVNEAYDHPRQPHIVQIAALLVDSETRETLEKISLITKPDGWIIPEVAIAVHGITMERAYAEGKSEKFILNKFIQLWHKAKFRVAHNEQFDAQIVRVAQMRFKYDETSLELWRTGKSECTQTLATPILKLPPTANMIKAGFNKPKSPKLEEAHSALLGYNFENPHDALADTIACKDIYFALLDLKEYGLDVDASLSVQALAATIHRVTDWSMRETNKWLTFTSNNNKYVCKIKKSDEQVIVNNKRLVRALEAEGINVQFKEI